MPPAPERKAPLASQVYPDAVPAQMPRQALHVGALPAKPERTSTLASSSYPDAVRGSAFPTSQQQGWESPAPYLVPNTSVPTEGYASFPLTVPGPLPRPQMATSTGPVKPERTSPFMASTASFPDAVPGPLPRSPMFVAALPVAPEERLPTPGGYSSYPEALRGPLPRQALHTIEIAPKPERKAPLFGLDYPSRIDPVLPRQHMAALDAVQLPPAVPTYAYQTSYPDFVRGPARAVVTDFQAAFWPTPPIRIVIVRKLYSWSFTTGLQSVSVAPLLFSKSAMIGVRR
jgi:hypothetical protein